MRPSLQTCRLSGMHLQLPHQTIQTPESGIGYDCTTAAFEARLKRDLAVLATLAHLRCASFHHLHTLCFPRCVVATARGGLSNLAAAVYVTHSRWMVRR